LKPAQFNTLRFAVVPDGFGTLPEPGGVGSVDGPFETTPPLLLDALVVLDELDVVVVLLALVVVVLVGLPVLDDPMVVDSPPKPLLLVLVGPPVFVPVEPWAPPAPVPLLAPPHAESASPAAERVTGTKQRFAHPFDRTRVVLARSPTSMKPPVVEMIPEMDVVGGIGVLILGARALAHARAGSPQRLRIGGGAALIYGAVRSMTRGVEKPIPETLQHARYHDGLSAKGR
jgi:hypothetical protein